MGAGEVLEHYEQLRAVQREADRVASSRDRAILQVLLCTGLAHR
jgi:hypothetical protein